MTELTKDQIAEYVQKIFKVGYIDILIDNLSDDRGQTINYCCDNLECIDCPIWHTKRKDMSLTSADSLGPFRCYGDYIHPKRDEFLAQIKILKLRNI